MFKRSRNWLKTNVRAFARDAEAVTAIEFGLMSPFFFGFIGIVMELSIMMFLEFALQTGVQEGGRYIRTGQAQNSKWTVADLKTKICDAAVIVPNCTNTVKVLVNAKSTFATLASAEPNDPSELGVDAAGNPVAIPYNCGKPLEVVAVMATYDHEFVMPMTGYFSNLSTNGAGGREQRRLTGYALFRNEPFPQTGNCG